MTDQTIQNKQAFVVVETKVSPAINTMERISKFYSRKGDAERFIKERVARYNWMPQNLAVAVFEYKEHYKIEDVCQQH